MVARTHGEPGLSLADAQDKIATEAKAPRVTEASIKDKIADVTYMWHGQLCLCIITMANGFMQVGKSAPASPENFNSEVGKRYAFEDAFKPLWHLEGYLLREKLARGEHSSQQEPAARPIAHGDDPAARMVNDPKGVG